MQEESDDWNRVFVAKPAKCTILEFGRLQIDCLYFGPTDLSAKDSAPHADRSGVTRFVCIRDNACFKNLNEFRPLRHEIST